MNIANQFYWDIREAYIKRLLELGVNPKFLQSELKHLDNDKLADLIRGIMRLTAKE